LKNNSLKPMILLETVKDQKKIFSGEIGSLPTSF